jgi:hypothetical protein
MAYFTCKLIKNVGIGDQLYQLQVIYNIGKTVGLKYIHTPLPPSRWCQNLDVSSFFGLGLGEESIDFYELKSYKVIDINAHELAVALVKGKDLEKLFNISEEPQTIYRLAFSEELYRENQHYIDIPIIFKFNFREKFLNSQKSSLEIYNPFKKDLISVAVHIRRGDCTWLEDDGKYIFPYMNKIIPADSNDVDACRSVPNELYLRLLENIFEQYDPELFDVRIYSDGIPEKFWIDLSLFQKIRQQIITKGLISLLKPTQRSLRSGNAVVYRKLKSSFEKMKDEFNLYNKFPNTTLQIGTSLELTKEIITAFALADIAILARENSFPDLGLRDFSQQILITVKTDQSENIALIKDLICLHQTKK